ncbi:MAG: hypothetical protein Alis3KO_03330 [Aliiglaciecola sp.]
MKKNPNNFQQILKKYNHVIGLFFCILLAVGAYFYNISIWTVLGVAVVFTVIEFGTNKEQD